MKDFTPDNIVGTLTRYFQRPDSPIKRRQFAAPSNNMDIFYKHMHAVGTDVVQHEQPDFHVDYIIHKMQQGQENDTDCAVCGDKHRFEECPTLKRVPPDFRSLLIRLGLNVRRMAREIARAGETAQPKQIRQLECSSLASPIDTGARLTHSASDSDTGTVTTTTTQNDPRPDQGQGSDF